MKTFVNLKFKDPDRDTCHISSTQNFCDRNAIHIIKICTKKVQF